MTGSFRQHVTWRRGVDMPMLLTVIALLVFGLIMLYSASFDFSFKEYGSSTYMFIRQVRWLGIGHRCRVPAFAVRLSPLAQLVVLAMLGTIGLVGHCVDHQ